MGSRSSTETLAALFVAFLVKKTWKQAELARECDLSVKSLRRKLTEMSAAGFPVENESAPPNAYWSVRDGWLASLARNTERIDSQLVARLVSRLESSALRERVLAKLVAFPLGVPIEPNTAKTAVSEETLTTVEDAVARRIVLRMDYQSAADGPGRVRSVSVQRIQYGERTRFVAVCHQSKTLKWFRIDRIQGRPRLDTALDHVAAPAEATERFVAESLDGFRGSGDVVACAFRVRRAEFRWVVCRAGVRRSHRASRRRCPRHAPHLCARSPRALVGLGGAVRHGALGFPPRAIAASRCWPMGEGAMRESVRSVPVGGNW